MTSPMPPPIILPQPLLKQVVANFLTLKGHKRADALLHHALVQRRHGRVALTASDATQVHSFVHLPAALPVTESMFRLESVRWEREALHFLVPLGDLVNAVRTAGPRERVLLESGRISVQAPPLRAREIIAFAAPSAARYPVQPDLRELAAGWHRSAVRTGRVDVMALAAL